MVHLHINKGDHSSSNSGIVGNYYNGTLPAENVQVLVTIISKQYQRIQELLRLVEQETHTNESARLFVVIEEEEGANLPDIAIQSIP
jgi:hypothetical protein